MHNIKINQWTELIYFDFGGIYLLRSYTFDINFLYEIRTHDMIIIRRGTYAYCYDFIANLEEKCYNNINED